MFSLSRCRMHTHKTWKTYGNAAKRKVNGSFITVTGIMLKRLFLKLLLVITFREIESERANERKKHIWSKPPYNQNVQHAHTSFTHGYKTKSEQQRQENQQQRKNNSCNKTHNQTKWWRLPKRQDTKIFICSVCVDGKRIIFGETIAHSPQPINKTV